MVESEMEGFGDGLKDEVEVITKEGFLKRLEQLQGSKSTKVEALFFTKKKTILCIQARTTKQMVVANLH